MRFGSRGPSEFISQIRHRNAFTEITWEDAEQGLGMPMSTLAAEKIRELLRGIIVYRQRVLQTVASLGVDSLVFRGHDLLKIANLIPARSRIFAVEEFSSPRERRKCSLHVGLGHN